MPNFERNLKQTLTYWAPTGVSDAFGKVTYASPVPLSCRWEDRIELFRDKRGQEFQSKAKVFLAVAIDLDGYLFKGTSAAADPTAVAGAYEVRQLLTTPDLRALKNMYVALL